MFCPIVQERVDGKDCSQFIIKASSEDLAKCRACEHGQALMQKTSFKNYNAFKNSKQPEAEIEIAAKARPEAGNKSYTSREIADLAGVSLEIVYNTRYRMGQGKIPQSGKMGKVVDVLEENNINWDMVVAESPKQIIEKPKIKKEIKKMSDNSKEVDSAKVEESKTSEVRTYTPKLPCPLEKISTGALLQELKKRIPEATVSISL